MHQFDTYPTGIGLNIVSVSALTKILSPLVGLRIGFLL